MQRLCLFLLLSAVSMNAADRAVTIRVLGTEANSSVAGVYSTANANCYGTATTGTCYGNGMAVPVTVQTVDIAVEIDGRPAMLHCDNLWHFKCYRLAPGTYEGRVKGNHAWVKAGNWDGSKSKDIKYAIH